VGAIRAEAEVFETLIIAAIGCIGLVGPVMIIFAARAALGERSRDIVGA